MGKTASSKRTSSKQSPLKRSKAIRKTPSKSGSSSVRKSSSSAKSSNVKGNSYQKTITMFKDIPSYFSLNNKYSNYGFNTRAIHSGNEPDQEFGAVAPAIH